MKIYKIFKRKAHTTFEDFRYYCRTPNREQAVTVCKHLNESGYDAYIELTGGESYENGITGTYICN